ncbi:MAG: AmmeMemoRadiSam system protein B [Chromatiaceae bacterium]|nr:AmmeMemoRadiSam system protein B [Chromatiaceae bacterium]
MSSIRPAAVAGQFYPGTASALADEVDTLLAHAKAHDQAPKALIVPHAGYIYSGPIAASAYVTLRPFSERIARVVLLGPSHRVALRGLASSSATAFSTPLGSIPIDQEARALLAKLPQVREFDAAHAFEHSLEVQLPFLQRLLEHFSLVPLVVGDATTEEVAEVLDVLWGGDESLILVSSDLSHYQSYAGARRLDAAATAAIESLRPEALLDEQACGSRAVRGLLAVARRRGLEVHTLDLRNSGDTAGPRDQVVGYGAYAFH